MPLAIAPLARTPCIHSGLPLPTILQGQLHLSISTPPSHSAMIPTPPVQFFRPKGDSRQSTGYRVYRHPAAGTETVVPLFLVQGMSAVGTTDWHDLATAMLKHDPKRVIVSFDNRDMGESTWSIDEKSKRFTLQDLAWDVINLAQVGDGHVCRQLCLMGS